MGFDIEAARADGLSEEEIQAAIAYGKSLEDTEEITTEEVVVTPEPPQPQPTTGFDVERAKADGLTDIEIQEAIEYGKSLEVTPTQPPQAQPQPTTGFDVEAAKADGLTDIEIQEAIEYGKSLEVTPTQPIPTDVEDTTFFGRVKQSFKEGIESFGDIGSGWDLAVQDVTGDKKEAAQQMTSIKGEAVADSLSRLPTLTAQDIQDEFQKSGLIPAGMKVPSFIVEQILKSGPQMIPPILAGMAATALSGGNPFVGGVVGIAAYGLQQFGNFMNTQGLEKEAPEELDTAAAAGWATVTAPIGFFADKWTLGLSKIPTKVLSKEITEELIKRTAAKSGVTAAIQGSGTGFARGAIAEAPTEVLETWAEFRQAGMDTNSEEAKQAYFEAFWAAAAMGGGLGSGTNAYQAHKRWKEAKKIQDEKDFEPDTDSSEENTELKADDILKGWNAAEKKQQRKQVNQDIKNRPRSTLNTLNKDTLEVMGVNEKNTPILYNALLNKSTTTKQGREEIKEIFDANSGNYVNVDSTAVNSFLKRIAKPNDSKTKRFNNRRTGASPVVSQQQPDPNETDTPIVETDERAPVDDGSGDTGRTGDGASQFNDTLKNKSPLNKNLKPKQKKSLAEIIDNKVVIRKGVVVKQKDGTLALQEDGSGEIITFNENQVINPTKKDQGVLSTIAEETKPKKQKIEEKVEDFIKGPQFAKDETPSDKQELEKLRFAVAEAENEARATEAQREPLTQRIFDRVNNARRELRAKEQEIEQRPPGQQELFAKGAIEKTKETKESILQSFINQYGKNVSLGLKRGFINILSTGADVTSEMLGGQKLPANVKAFYNNGKAYFIADRIKASDAPSMLLHEIGAHYGLEAMLGKANYDRVVKSLNNKKNSDKDIKAAYDYVVKKYPELTEGSPDFIQEVIAKIGEQTPNNTLFRQVVGYIKNFLSKLGMGWNVDNISVAEIQDMIQQSLRVSLAKEASQDARPGILTEQPMFAKQDTKDAEKLYEESNPEKPTPNQEKKSKDAFEKNMEESTVSFFSSKDKFARFANAVFSFDNALNSAIRKAMEASGINPELQKKLLTKISLSQALHAEALGEQFVIFGLINYNPETGKWNAVQGNKNTPTLKKISQSLKKIAKQRGLTEKKLRKMAGAAITGKRLRLLKDQQSAEIARAKVEFDKGNKQKAKDILKDLKIIHKTDAEIDAMVEILDKIPQLNKIYDDWLAIRDEAVDALVIAQKLPQSEVDKYKAEVDFVPFYRVQEELNRIGPNASSRGLIDNKWYKFKGSYEPVNDVFENMEMWAKYSIRRAVLNQAAINKVDATIAMLPDMVRQVADASGANTQPIERRNSSGNIETVYYQFADPTFAAAFGGMEQANIGGMSIAAKFANILRANVVLYPLFSIAQLPQDAVSAMFSSGVKYPFMIPLRVLFEFPATFLNLSKTHKTLSKIGAVGSFGSFAQTAFDVNNRNVKEMGPIRKSIELLTNTPVGEINEIPISILGLLNRLAMASDNAIRQAVYAQTMSETNDVGLAEERAFEIINFKRGGSSGVITGLRQVVPFFGAALQALSVQGRMLGGKGIAPTKNDGKLISASAKQFMSTWAQVTTATLLYNLLMDDDEEYKKLDPALRDRRILLGNGYHITLRPDIFTYMSKMVPEQIFQYTFRGSEDSQKFTKRLKMGLLDVLGNAPVPQIIRPAMELAFNESILTDRPIVPQSTDSELLSGDPEMQAKASTSELAKMLGEASGLNPLQVDYFLKQYFGYTIGLGLMLTDEIIADRNDNYERPGKSERDMIATIPGMSAFITREYGNRHTADYYELKELVSDAYKSFNALDKKSWDRSKSVKFSNKHASLIKAQEYIKTKDKILTQIRARRARVLNAPLNMMNAEDKRLELLRQNELEQKTLFDILEMRKQVFDDKTGTYRRKGQESNNPFN